MDHDLIDKPAATAILAALMLMVGVAAGVLTYFVFIKFGM